MKNRVTEHWQHLSLKTILTAIFCVFLFESIATNRANGQNNSAPLDASIIAGLSADSSTDVAAMDKYEAAVEKLLELERYDLLEKEGNANRSEKRRFGGGVWKLYIFYRGLEEPTAMTADGKPDWDAYIRKLNQWKDSMPNSITARVALAGGYFSYGSHSRGYGWASSVAPENWKKLANGIATAKEILDEAEGLTSKDPHSYYLMQNVALQQGLSPDKELSLYKKATALEPTYYSYYRMHSMYLQTKWYGEEGDAERFADSVVESADGKLGDIYYFEMASQLICIVCNERQAAKELSWTHIKRGYEQAEAIYGHSIYKLNQLAGMAVAFEDETYARQLFDKIGENWDRTTWGNRKFFEANKAWAASAEPDFRLEILEAAKSNRLTPEGRKFDASVAKTFQSKLGPAITRCISSGSAPAENFDMFLRLSAGGTPNGGLVIPAVKLVSCIRPDTKNIVFDPPPQPDYWVRISMKFTK
jgi:hypothetical protein